MNIPVVSLENAEESKIDLPSQFSETISPSLIARAVITAQLNKRQPYGAKPSAGTRVSSDVSKRRRDYRGSYGKGISRVPRKVMSRRGRQIFWQGALAPGTVAGRRAHPPKASKLLDKKINKKENSKAIRSALSATIVKDLVSQHGHKVPKGYPFAINDSITKVDKTKTLKATLVKLGLTDELTRTAKKTIRAGRGKSRGRKYDRKIGPLIVVVGTCPLEKAASNLPGVEVVHVNQLHPELLAPGAIAGRLTIFTPAALNKLKEDKLYS